MSLLFCVVYIYLFIQWAEIYEKTLRNKQPYSCSSPLSNFNPSDQIRVDT